MSQALQMLSSERKKEDKERRQDNTFFLSEWYRSLAYPFFHKKPGPAPLLQKLPPTFLQHGSLPLVDTLEPVPEPPRDSHEDGVPVDGISGEEWAHLETELPPADGGAWGSKSWQLQGELRRG